MKPHKRGHIKENLCSGQTKAMYMMQMSFFDQKKGVEEENHHTCSMYKVCIPSFMHITNICIYMCKYITYYIIHFIYIITFLF